MNLDHVDTAWLLRAACKDEPTPTFFDRIWPVDSAEEQPEPLEERLAYARSFCDRCTVRQTCFAEVMEQEGDDPAMYRYGLRAGLTPAQRWSLKHRGTIDCPVCEYPLDPKDLRAGVYRCLWNGCDIDRELPPVPDAGDKWGRRHTTLARKVLRWLEDHVAEGATIPPAKALATEWGDRKTDMSRVYQALLIDGSLVKVRTTYIRGTVRRHEAFNPDRWVPAHLVLSPEEE